MRNMFAAALVGALIVSPTLVLADTAMAPGKPAGVKNAQVIDTPIFAIALVGAIGLAVGLSSGDDGVTPVPVAPPATSTST